MQNLVNTSPTVEHHPLKPFLPQNAKMLMLGSFPPKKERWSIDFFYPNFQNDMWRIMGIIYFNNPLHFVLNNSRKFNQAAIVKFCNEHGIAIFDTATAVQRLKDNASDKYLNIVETTDLSKILTQLPECKLIITTGEKATDTIAQQYNCEKPAVGKSVNLEIDKKKYKFYRMPSSSRAYPLALYKKAEIYKTIFNDIK